MTGIVVFAAEGAMTANLFNLNLLGVMVIALISALGGGMIRDVLIGSTPPVSLLDGRYIALACTTGILTYVGDTGVHQIPPELLVVLDAAGLGLFAVAGVEKAMQFNFRPFVAMLLGTLNAVGGGVIRDVLLNRVPVIMQTDFYASAALTGTFVVFASRRLGLSYGASGVLGGLACFGLRMFSFLFDWHFPRP